MYIFYLRISIIWLILFYFDYFVDSEVGNLGSPDSSKLKIVTLNDDLTFSVNDGSKYNFRITGLLKDHLEYEFNDGSRCKSVIYGDDTVWSSDSSRNQSENLKKIKLDLSNSILWIVYGDVDFATFHFKDSGKWEMCRELSFGCFSDSSEEVSQMDVSILTSDIGLTEHTDGFISIINLDINVKKSTDEFVYYEDKLTKFGLYFTNDLFVLNVIRDGSLNSEDSGPEVVWKPSDYKDYSKCVILNGVGTSNVQMSIYLARGIIKYFHKSGICSKWVEGPLKNKSNDSTKFEVLPEYKYSIKIFAEGSVVPIDHTKYDLKFRNNSLDYIFKKDVKCTGFSINDEVVWKHSGDPGDPYPKSISFYNVHKFEVVFENKFIFCIKHNQWDLKEWKYPPRIL